MRRHSDLKAFLSSDGPSQYLTRKVEQVEGFRSVRPVADLIAKTGPLYSAGAFNEIDVEIESFLSGDLGFIRESIVDWITESAQDDKILPAFRDAVEFDEGLFSNVNLVRRAGISLTISSLSGADLAVKRENGSKSRVQFSGQKVYFKFLIAKRLLLNVWECDPFGDSSDFATLRCWKAKELVVHDGDVVEVDGTFQSLSFVSCEGSAVFLQVENIGRDVGSSVAFESGSGEYLATFPTSRPALRKMVMCSALRHLETQDRLRSLPPAVQLGPFYQRWHVIREILAAGAINRRALLEGLLAQDKNPSVRRAATATLDLIAKQESVDVG